MCPRAYLGFNFYLKKPITALNLFTFKTLPSEEHNRRDFFKDFDANVILSLCCWTLPRRPSFLPFVAIRVTSP